MMRPLLNALLYFPSRTIEQSPADAGLAHVDVEFETADGERLHGWWAKRRAVVLGHVLLCHGNAGNVGDRVLHAALLTAAGFDPGKPTAWSAEGLLPYLAADAQCVLFERIQSLSAPGSRVAVEAFTNEFFSADSFARREEQTELYRNVAIKLGGKDITESGNLLYEGERTEVVDWLRAHGWSVASATSADDLMAASNRAAPAGLDAAIPESVFVEGRLR